VGNEDSVLKRLVLRDDSELSVALLIGDGEVFVCH